MKARLRSGRRERSTGIARETSAKAESVPMLTISSSLPIGVRLAMRATAAPMITVRRTGVPVLGLVRPSHGGSSQSRDIANVTRVAPMIRVITTVIRPATAPAAIRVAKPGLPTDSKADASAALGSISVYFTMPVMTSVVAT